MHSKRDKPRRALEIIGWYGPLAVLLAFALVSFGVVEGRSYAFQLLNLTGSIAFISIALHKKIYQVVVLNAVLTIIALVTILDLLF